MCAPSARRAASTIARPGSCNHGVRSSATSPRSAARWRARGPGTNRGMLFELRQYRSSRPAESDTDALLPELDQPIFVLGGPVAIVGDELDRLERWGAGRGRDV